MSDVTIIGGGLAGLACATRLARAGASFTLLEATDRVGGRVRTDAVEGFLLDHGFQLLPTEYPACRELLDYEALRLRRFAAGVMIRSGGAWTPVPDLWRRPSRAIRAAWNSGGSVLDALRLVRLRRGALRGTLEDLYERPQQPTADRLADLGFSDRVIDQYLRPLLRSVFLERDLETSSRALELAIRTRAVGDVAVPAAGMQAVAAQLAARLPSDSVRLEQTVAEVASGRVRMTSGEARNARAIVVATEEPAAARLLGRPSATAWQRTATFYYAADAPPVPHARLMLSGDPDARLSHVAVMSNVARCYAPPGQALVSASVVEPDREALALEPEVRDELRQWFGAAVDRWRPLRAYDVPFAVPAQGPSRLDPVVKEVALGDGIFLCGDHRETASIQGALNSGVRAGRAVLEFLKG